MGESMNLDHIAVLVDDIEDSLRSWRLPEPGEIETFEAEGTRELYCGSDSASARVLLMQAIGPGPYARARAKRGAGLHHLAICVDDVVAFASRLEGTGWLLHPRSLEFYTQRAPIWLCRPGFPCLIEVLESQAPGGDPIVSSVELAVPDELAPMIAALDCPVLRRAPGEKHVLVIGDQRIEL